MFPDLATTISSLPISEISSDRKVSLRDVINYIDHKRDNGETVKLNFICTHNSRRSQMAQIWAQTAAKYYSIAANCFSGGVEVTAFNEQAVDTLKKNGFKINKEGDDNPIFLVRYSASSQPITTFSKLYDDMANPTEGFAAIMTCSNADENCPFIPGADSRIPLLYDDPKEFDHTPLMAEKYLERSMEIATEMFYVFSQINAR